MLPAVKSMGLNYRQICRGRSGMFNFAGYFIHSLPILFMIKSALPNSQNFAKDGIIVGIMTNQPKWEGTARFTYRPDKQWSLFTQCRYVDQMQLSIYDDASSKIQSSLTTWDLGVKYKINKSSSWQWAVMIF